MADKGFTLRFELDGPLSDGTWVALCQEVPMIVTATTEAALLQSVRAAVNSLTERLEGLTTDAAVKFLKESGVKVRVKDEAENRTMTFPLSLGTAAR